MSRAGSRDTLPHAVRWIAAGSAAAVLLLLTSALVWARKPGVAAPLPRMPAANVSLDADANLPNGASTHRESDFIQDPTLTATGQDLVVFDLEPALGGGGRLRDNLARYRLQSGTYFFCFDDDEPHLVSLALHNAGGKRILSLHRQQRVRNRHADARNQTRRQCERATLHAGVYHLRATHDAGSVGDSGRLTFVQLSAHSPQLVDGAGRPMGGLWALAPGSTLDPQRRQGRLAAPPPDRDVSGTPYTAIRPLIADFTSQVIDESALFDFSDLSGPLVGLTPLNLAKLDQSGSWTAFADDGPTNTNPFFRTAPLVVTDLSGNQVQLGVQRANGQLTSFFLRASAFSPTTVTLNYDALGTDPPAAGFNLLFRFYADGTQIGPLQEGEVAIFQECNYQGKAAVFTVDIPDFATLTSSVITLDKTAASIRFGNNTAVFLNSGPIYTGTRQLVTADTACLSSTPIGNNNTSSILVRPIAPIILLSSKACVDCKLEGVDLSGLTLSGINLQGADLTGANLANAVIAGTNFAGAILAGATLTGLSLQSASGWSGATLDQVTGLAGSKQSQAILDNVSLQGVDLSNAQLQGASLNKANLTGSTLYNAFLSNNINEKITDPASLRQAHLKNVNLAFAQLSGVDFSFANFYGTTPASNSSCKTTGSNHSGFTVDCASAHQATMTGTTLTSAYLYGVDFANAAITGADFSQAVLTGANFGGASITTNVDAATTTKFAGAYLQGTNLDKALALNQAVLSDAFVDFRDGGNEVFIDLGELHNQFACFPPSTCTPPSGADVCVWVRYPQTTVATGNTTITCPDGNPAGANGCGAAAPSNGRWNSGLMIGTPVQGGPPPGWYSNEATYTPKAPDNVICNGRGPSARVLDW
jgi:uncharacterized protein YjbI with pentapeptide repeats